VNSPRPQILAVLASVAVAVAGCGGGPEQPDEPPAELLRHAAENPAPSGEAKVDLSLDLKGSSPLAGATSLDLIGPFELAEGAELPRLELAAEAEVAGFGIDGALISTGEDAFVDFFGEVYRVGPERIAQIESGLSARGDGLGLDVSGWVADPRYGEIEEVAGAETQRIEGTLRAGAAAAELAALAESLGAPPLIRALAAGAGEGPAEAWVAFDDETIRRLRIQFPFTVPPDLLGVARGITGGAAILEVEISDVGAEVEIEPPAGGGFKPIEQLIAELRSLASLGGL